MTFVDLWPGWPHFLIGIALWITVPLFVGYFLGFYAHLFWRGVRCGWRVG